MVYHKLFLKGTPCGMSPVGKKTEKDIRKRARQNKNIRKIKPMKQAMKVYEEKCDKSDLMCTNNKKQESIPNPSYSMMHALKDGFSIMMYSSTHDTQMSNGCVHRKHAVRLILNKGIRVMWHESLYHSGAIQSGS